MAHPMHVRYDAPASGRKPQLTVLFMPLEGAEHTEHTEDELTLTLRQVEHELRLAWGLHDMNWQKLLELIANLTRIAAEALKPGGDAPSAAPKELRGLLSASDKETLKEMHEHVYGFQDFPESPEPSEPLRSSRGPRSHREVTAPSSSSSSARSRTDTGSVSSQAATSTQVDKDKDKDKDHETGVHHSPSTVLPGAASSPPVPGPSSSRVPETPKVTETPKP